MFTSHKAFYNAQNFFMYFKCLFSLAHFSVNNSIGIKACYEIKMCFIKKFFSYFCGLFIIIYSLFIHSCTVAHCRRIQKHRKIVETFFSFFHFYYFNGIFIAVGRFYKKTSFFINSCTAEKYIRIITSGNFRLFFRLLFCLFIILLCLFVSF